MGVGDMVEGRQAEVAEAYQQGFADALRVVGLAFGVAVAEGRERSWGSGTLRLLGGEGGRKLAEMAGATIRSVAQGVLGVAVIQAVLAGERGPRRDVVVINAAPAIVAAGLAEGFAEGVALAQRSIASGAAAAVLQRVVEIGGESAPR